MTVEFGWWFLLLQTFLLMLAAFLLGAMFACVLRRALYNLPDSEQPRAVPLSGEAVPAPTDRPAAVVPPRPAPQPAVGVAPRATPPPPRPAASPAAPPEPAVSPLPSGRQLDTARFERALKGVEALSEPPPARAAPAAPSKPAPPATPAAPPAPAAPARPAATAVVSEPRVVTPVASSTGGPATVSATVISPPPAAADDLTRIRGIDTDLVKALAALGVTRFSQIAAWTAADVASIGTKLGNRPLITRGNWIEQAVILAKGQDTSYSRRRRRGEAVVAAPRMASPVAAASSQPSVTAAAPAARPPAAPQAQPAAPDDLQRIRGISVEIARALNQHGISRFAQIAAWSAEDVARFDSMLGAPGRVAHGNWIEQAQILAKGSLTSFARQAEAQQRIAAQQPLSAPEPPRPARLADAIKEQAQRPAAVDARAPRADLAGLRSVRSEALVGADGVQEAGRAMIARPGAAGDDLKRIRGIGVLIEKKLNSLGISRYEQIANWAGADVDRISQLLDFRGRIERENWVEQARILASGGQTEFSRRVDKGEAETSRQGKV